MRLFGIGLPKTGTNSVASAISMMGIGVTHNWRTNGEALRVADWAYFADNWAYFDGIAGAYRGIHGAFPGSKFIYTYRNPHDVAMSSWQHQRRAKTERTKHWGDYAATVELATRHTESVLSYFGNSDRLLVFEVGKHGWRELSDFLDLPQPNREFPCLNTSGNPLEFSEDMSLRTPPTRTPSADQ